jgi:polysaccharide biosynthesis transport protein
MSNHNQPPMLTPSPYHPASPVSPSPSADYGTEISQGLCLQEYFHILLKRKWWVINTFLTIFVLAALYTFIRTPIYRSSAILQITQDNPGSQVTSIDDKLSLLNSTDTLEKFQQTQYKILESWTLAQRVAQVLNIYDHPDFKSIRNKGEGKTESEIQNAIIDQIQKQIEVIPVKNSYLVEVAYQSSDKGLSQRIVNAIADEYLYLSIDARNKSFTLVRKWLDSQLGEMAGKVQEAQKKLYKFGQKSDIYTADDKDNVVMQKFIDLSSLLTKAQAEKMAKEAQYNQIKDKGPDAPLIVNNPLVAALRQQLVNEQAKVSAMEKVFRGDHPDLKAERANLSELRTRLQAEVKRLQNSVRADYEAASRTEKLLSDSFTKQKGQMTKLQDNLTDFQILKRDAQANEQLYQALLSRVKEINISATMVPSSVAVIEPGRLSEKPFKPKPLRDLSLAAFLGLALGVGLAFVMEQLDDSIKSVDDLEHACSLPSLGIVPILRGNGSLSHSPKKLGASGIMGYLSWLQRKGVNGAEVTDENMDLIVANQPQSLVSEAIGHIYSSIMLSTSGRPPGAILVTSPNPSEGKSTLVANLALSYALNDRQVVLIDCDLRKPRLHQIFQMTSQPGLANYLTGNATLEEILRPTPIPNLTIITAGPRTPSPLNLLNSEILRELISELRERFLHIIVDTPPVLGFADARCVSRLVDGVLLVTKHNVTHKTAGRLAHQLLDQANVLGAVLNCVGPYGKSYGGYYYYSHYKYYSKYSEGDTKDYKNVS